MRFKDYLVGRKLVLFSRHSPAEVGERINGAAGSTISPFSFGVVGWARFGRVRLRVRSSLLDYNAKPMLVGKLVEDPAGTRFEARFGATLWMKAFVIYWYLFLAIFAVFSLIYGPFRGAEGEAIYSPYLMLPVFAVAPLAMHYLFATGSEDELDTMVDFLAKEAGFRSETPVSGTGRR